MVPPSQPSLKRGTPDVSFPGVCVREIAEHSHYVQGVAWDPMNEYIATQSSDRCVELLSVDSVLDEVPPSATGDQLK